MYAVYFPILNNNIGFIQKQAASLSSRFNLT